MICVAGGMCEIAFFVVVSLFLFVATNFMNKVKG